MESITVELLLNEHTDAKKTREHRQKRDRREPHINHSSESKSTKKSEAINRALSRFSISPRPQGIPNLIEPPPATIELEWAINAVPKETQRIVGKIVCRPGEFGWLHEDRVSEISKKIDNYPITLEQALSLRSALNQEKSVYSHGRLISRSNELKRRYDSGQGVISLSKKFDAPPVNTFRAILTGRGWSKTKIKETLKSPSKLNERDKKEFLLAEEQDKVSSVNQSETQSAAEIFEDILCNYFTSLGVRFRRQEELLKEQKKSEGRAVITPDLLFLDDIRINDIPCAWIDAKHFFGADLKFPKKKTQKQVDRYVKEYGQGAIVYRHGFCQSLNLNGAIQLDSSPLDLSLLAHFHEKSRKKPES
jgi:hypothetical protein